MAIAPQNSYGVIADRLHAHHLERRRVQLKWRGLRFERWRLGLGSVRAAAHRAGAVMAQIAQSVFAGMAILPIDLDPLRFGDRDVLGIGGDELGVFDFRHGSIPEAQLSSRSMSRTPEMRRIATMSFSNCFLSRTSTVISMIAPSPCSASVLASRLRMLVFSVDRMDVS